MSNFWGAVQFQTTFFTTMQTKNRENSQADTRQQTADMLDYRGFKYK